MKRLLFVLSIASLAIACNNQPKTEEKAAGTEAKSESSGSGMAANLPYSMQYTNWAWGDPQNTRMILDMYKNWEDNKLDAVAAVCADSTTFDDPGGHRAITTKATIMDSLKAWRSQSAKLSTNVITAISLHSPDKSEDWVCIWAMNHWTDTKGKTDSAFANDNWQIKGGKIVYMTSLEQKPIRNTK